jgi:Sap, sulfolipid-1-addressing protein
MWATVLMLAFISATEPIRIGIAAFLIALPRPMHNLFAYWLGLMTSGFGIALVTLFFLRDFALPIAKRISAFFEIPVVPPIQISIGVVALAVMAGLVVRASLRSRVPVGDSVVSGPMGGPPVLLDEPSTPGVFARMSAWTTRLEGGSTKMAFVAGLSTSMPPVEYWGAVMAILATGAVGGPQIAAMLVFVLVAFAIAEIPLICYLIAPAKTKLAITQLHAWLNANRRPLLLGILGMFGFMMIANGAGWV